MTFQIAGSPYEASATPSASSASTRSEACGEQAKPRYDLCYRRRRHSKRCLDARIKCEVQARSHTATAWKACKLADEAERKQSFTRGVVQEERRLYNVPAFHKKLNSPPRCRLVDSA